MVLKAQWQDLTKNFPFEPLRNIRLLSRVIFQDILRDSESSLLLTNVRFFPRIGKKMENRLAHLLPVDRYTEGCKCMCDVQSANQQHTMSTCQQERPKVNKTSRNTHICIPVTLYKPPLTISEKVTFFLSGKCHSQTPWHSSRGQCVLFYLTHTWTFLINDDNEVTILPFDFYPFDIRKITPFSQNAISRWSHQKSND